MNRERLSDLYWASRSNSCSLSIDIGDKGATTSLCFLDTGHWWIGVLLLEQNFHFLWLMVAWYIFYEGIYSCTTVTGSESWNNIKATMNALNYSLKRHLLETIQVSPSFWSGLARFLEALVLECTIFKVNLVHITLNSYENSSNQPRQPRKPKTYLTVTPQTWSP